MNGNLFTNSPYGRSNWCMSEQKLIDKARKGNRRSQNELYKVYYNYAMSIALRFSSSRDEASEIAHDAFIKMFSNLDKYDNDQLFKPWLRKIVVNASIDHFRKYQHVPQHLEVLENDSQVSNDGLEQLTIEELMRLISMLSPAYRIVFSLYIVEGFSHKEIAEQLDITVGTSKSNLAKARYRLQEMVTVHFGTQNRSHG